MEGDLCNILGTEKITSLVRLWLQEDNPSFDFGGFVVGQQDRKAQLLIKSPGVVAGVPFFNAVFKELNCQVEWFVKEGETITANLPLRIALVHGKCKDILLGERVALNCLCRMSGIASTARNYCEKAKIAGWNGKVSGTRKTTPGFRLAEKYALLVGGADTHRYDLSAMVMLKDNHIWSSGSISKAVEKVKSASGFSLKVEVECQSLDDGLEAAEAGADVVMFDNFQPESLLHASSSLKSAFPHVLVEASGGINEKNFPLYCGRHVDIISTSTLTQGYPVVDFSLKILKDD